MNTPSKPMLVASLILAQLALCGSLYAAQSVDPTADKTIAAKLKNDLVVVLTNDSGKLNPGENAVCVVIRDPRTGEAADVQNVSIEFSLRTGRIVHGPITARLARESAGRYCGNVNLGRQYYKPMNFYVGIRYMDPANKSRRVGLSLDVE